MEDLTDRAPAPVPNPLADLLDRIDRATRDLPYVERLVNEHWPAECASPLFRVSVVRHFIASEIEGLALAVAALGRMGDVETTLSPSYGTATVEVGVVEIVVQADRTTWDKAFNTGDGE